MAFKFTKSKFFVYAASAVLLLLLIFLGRELNRKYLIQTEIRNLESEITRLESENKDVRNLINYLKTPEYEERQARSLLNLQKSGEFAVVLPQNLAAGQTEQGKASRDERPNIMKWRSYFFEP